MNPTDHMNSNRQPDPRDAMNAAPNPRGQETRPAPVHISRLRLMAKSAMHFAAGDVAESYALERGSAVHAMVFGTGRVIGYPGKVRNGKAWDEFEAANADAIILTGNEYAKARAMADQVLKCREAMRVLDGIRETELAWSIGGRACAGTPDVVAPGQWVTELKTCPSSDPFRAQWHGRKQGYHAQIAWYMDGLFDATKVAHEIGYVVAVEATAPFPVTVMRLTQRALDEGRRMYRAWWERLMVCEAANEYPGYVQSIVDFDVPDDEQQLDFGDEAAA
jgi:hypothetical protein